MIKNLFSVSIILYFTSTVHAYIGPGMGGGVIAGILGIIFAIFLGLVAIIWYPIKRLLSRFKKK